MKKEKTKVVGAEKLEQAIENDQDIKFLLRLFITGTTPQSTKALSSIKQICETHLKGRYELEVIDLYKNPGLARSEQIIAAPTLVKKLPLPLRRIIGDMSEIDKVLVGLDLKLVNDK
jgi:circadian clock protein KaiB